MRHLIARLFVPRRLSSPEASGAAVTLPAAPACGGSQGDVRSLGTLRRFEMAVMPELVSRGVTELVHGGSDDLHTWPASLPERQVALDWIATGEPSIREDLYRLCGSEDRAGAICEQAYIDQRARSADELLARAFGVDLEVHR